MIKKRIETLRKKFQEFEIDGYIIPKNDEFFSEYSEKDRLKIISNFSGSAGIAVILKNKNYLFVDGRYTLQAQIEAGENFKLVKYEKIANCNIFKNLKLGIDPKLFTSNQIRKTFLKRNKIKEINLNLVDEIYKSDSIKRKPFYSLSNEVVGESHLKKINKIINYLKKNNIDYIFISAPENVAWTLNIRGFDNPNSPIPNCRLLINKNKKLHIISTKNEIKNLIKEKKIKAHQIIQPKNFKKSIGQLMGNNILIDSKSCSLFYENLFKSKFKIIDKEEPVYLLKSIKNKVEVKNMINTHISDGVALTKFIYWIKKINKKKITEVDAQNKLEFFRKMNKNYLFPSFNTIAGSGKNGAIIHYRATKENSKTIKNKDIFLCDSGGQYKYGTTDVTRTICFLKPKNIIKNIFTKVLKGHIAVARTNLKIDNTGKKIDLRARKFLKRSNLDYEHGTGHGVGYFLNVHEGPQSISKFNNIKIQEGMILSNEPGYYKKGEFGIRIENLLYVKKKK
jgi:Xaa-Pro aminopeptidase